jgi:hypothetical protein
VLDAYNEMHRIDKDKKGKDDVVYVDAKDW